MKRNTFFLIITILMSVPVLGQQKSGYCLNGNFSNIDGSFFYLSYTIEGKQITDTVKANKGSFIFKGNLPEPCVAMLTNDKHTVQRLFMLDNSKISMSSSTPDGKISVKGAGNQLEYETLQDEIMNNRANAIKAFESENKELGDSLVKNEYNIIKRFIKSHPDSYLSANQLFYQTNDGNIAESKVMYEAFSQKVKNSYQGKQVAERLATLQKVQLGKAALDFVQNDTLGRPLRLSDYKGKYVLIEFWASWCGPCRAEGPNLLKAYEKFKDSGLIIIAVSLDKDASQWKRAIVKDHLPWIHVSDLKYFNNEVAEKYGVHAVPANFLVNPDGIIIAKDLRGEKLHQELSAIFK